VQHRINVDRAAGFATKGNGMRHGDACLKAVYPPRSLCTHRRHPTSIRAWALAHAVPLATFAAVPQALAIERFPKGVRIEDINVNGTTLHVRVGGKGPVVVMLHGFGDTGDMWAPLAAALIADHTVIIPDLRGMGLSAHPESGYDKKNQAHDIAAVMDRFGAKSAELVTHDIGNMVGYALVAQYPERITKWVAMDAPLPGIGPWEKQLLNPLVWHFNFRGPDVERLVKGRERIYLDRFYNELSANPKAIDEATRAHYAKLYARPGAMHSAFSQFAAFAQDAEDNKVLDAKGKIAIPVLAIGAQMSYGATMADLLRFVATDVTAAVIPNSGHWIMEEQPAFAVRMISGWLDSGTLSR
jgi:pimeloyl-ACP methyl ester carboxylesterase